MVLCLVFLLILRFSSVATVRFKINIIPFLARARRGIEKPRLAFRTTETDL